MRSIKDAYTENLAQQGEIQRAGEICASDTEIPVFSGYSVHPEDEPSLEEINRAIAEIAVDITAVRRECLAAATRFGELMATVNLQLDAADELLTAEENRIKDLNVICGNYQEFTSVRTLAKEDFSGDFSMENGNVFTAKKDGTRKTGLAVIQVGGNGYEGNAYVKNPSGDGFLEDTVFTGHRENMIDGSGITAYEYSRLTSTGEEKFPPDVNFDQQEAECAVTFRGDDLFTALKVKSSRNGMTVTDVLTSSNGATFESCWEKERAIFDTDEQYLDNAYAYGSGILTFPATQYLKVVFRSGGAEPDAIAFSELDDSDAASPVKKLVNLPNTQRHVVRLENVEAELNTYMTSCALATGELVSAPVESIAVFANEYLPPNYPHQDGYVQYVLTVNGKDYEVVPINSYRSGVKVIRCTHSSVLDDYVVHIDESIKSARLTMIIQSADGCSTPYVSNLKICLGKTEAKG